MQGLYHQSLEEAYVKALEWQAAVVISEEEEGAPGDTLVANSSPQCQPLHLPSPLFVPSSPFPFRSRNGLTLLISRVTIFSFAYISEKWPCPGTTA